MQATPKQRITLYLLALLFIWANGFAAPYQSIQSVATYDNITDVSAAIDVSNHENNNQISAFEIPSNDYDQNIYGAYPAEETYEEEDLNRDGEDLQFVFLPEFLLLPQLSANQYPSFNMQHDDYRAELNQSTYLLDCTFLI